MNLFALKNRAFECNGQAVARTFMATGCLCSAELEDEKHHIHFQRAIGMCVDRSVEPFPY